MIKGKIIPLLPLIALVLIGVPLDATCQTWNPNYSIGTVTGNYNFSYNQTPDQLVEIYPAAFPNTGLTYQWESSPYPTIGFTAISGATLTSYSIPGPLSHTTYYRRKATSSTLGSVYSNIIKISVVSVNWEDINYVREHEVDTIGVSSWTTVDQLPIGEKFQTTSYMDGLGRPQENIMRGAATPANPDSLWGDIVEFNEYDTLGREPKKYLPYSTTSQPGKFKTSPLTDQPAYYTAIYSETSAFDSIYFDSSPLNRILNVKESGTAWAASRGDSVTYDVNSAADSVQLFSLDYVQGDSPVAYGVYLPGTLYKITYKDVNNHQVVEYTNMSGELILRKVQIDSIPSSGHAGWICTYSIYDDFGLLRYRIQPDGVNFLDSNGWSFAGTNGEKILGEQCFQYNYDDKGRTIWKKSPGAAPLNMIYDTRDRLVFMQDGNQANLSTPQWTAVLYDGLDRPVITTLYNTTESIASLQNDIASSITTSTVSTSYAGTPVSNLVLNTRNTTIYTYAASTSITFEPGFATTSGDSFIAHIDSAASTPSGTITTAQFNNPISSDNLNNSSVTTILKYFYYDNYSFPNVKTFDNTYTNLSAYGTSNPDVIAIASSQRVFDMPTGCMTRVLGTNIFLSSSLYYDERGRHIQALEDNIKTGTDITTLQYHFDGRVLSGCFDHSAPGTGYNAYIILTKYIFDKLGRVDSLQEQFGSNSLNTVSAFDYDDMGRVKTNVLDPTYSNPNSGAPDLESLTYSYNIHNQITGINKDYALKDSSYNKWGHFFGLYLGYDNSDGVFAKPQLDGHVTGEQWNTQGDDAQRKYDYSYDNAGRFTQAAFNQQQEPGDGWSNSSLDFSVSGSTGGISYDNNGNQLSMEQKGVVPGMSSPITIDSLGYSYNAYSNKLESVTDYMSDTSMNGLFGDFKDGNNAPGTPDYAYDTNGNEVLDLNKNVQSLNKGAAGTDGISYNFLDKPDQIRVVGKGTIKILYDADGNKLQRVFIPDSGGISTITTYINQFVYQDSATLTTSSSPPYSGNKDSLVYINFEEGRLRVMEADTQSNGYDALSEAGNINLPNGKMGAWDYFVMDYQQNVRMILTEETHSAVNTCTMETSRASAEDPVFGQPGAGNEVETTRFPTPSGWQSIDTSAYVSRLGNLAGQNLGPNTLQKVMAGDLVSATVQYYYEAPVTNSNPNIIPNILSSLAQSLSGSSQVASTAKANATPIAGELNSDPAFIDAVEPSSSTDSVPQAYLTILFFDERFNLVSSADGGLAQEQVASTWSTSTPPLGLVNIKAPKNGYVYVYVSNRSNQDVYFDNLAVGIVAGNIIEENHYYPYGLKITGISSDKFGDADEGKLSNPYLYNDKELLDENGDLGWLDYGFRNYDPQIGRFPLPDPLTDEYPGLSPYQYAGNEPVGNADEAGLGIISTLAEVGCSTFTTSTSALASGVEIAIQAASLAAAGLNLTEGIEASENLDNLTSQSVGFLSLNNIGPNDWVMNKNKGIYWDPNAKSQSTTKSGETYLGKELQFTFDSYINNTYDGPFKHLAIGDKLTSTITLKTTEDKDGNIIGVDIKSTYVVGKTGGYGINKGRAYFKNLPNYSGDTHSNSDVFSSTFVQHASVPFHEEIGLNLFGYSEVDVAQKLTVSSNGNNKLR